MCLDFILEKRGVSVGNDVVFGSNKGDISVLTEGKFYIVNEEAHQGQINCIKCTDLLSSTPSQIQIITAGEDGFIKIWDSSIRPLHSINLKEKNSISDYNNLRSYGIQSLDLYACDPKFPRALLVALRCGDIYELFAEGESDQMQFQVIQNLNISGHSSLKRSEGEKKVFLATNPDFPIFASVGDDETLKLWDM